MFLVVFVEDFFTCDAGLVLISQQLQKIET